MMEATKIGRRKFGQYLGVLSVVMLGFFWATPYLASAELDRAFGHRAFDVACFWLLAALAVGVVAGVLSSRWWFATSFVAVASLILLAAIQE
jgi:hypothetical protein